MAVYGDDRFESPRGWLRVLRAATNRPVAEGVMHPADDRWTPVSDVRDVLADAIWMDPRHRD